MPWISSFNRMPTKEKWYRVLCTTGKAYKCKFTKRKCTSFVYHPPFFKHKGRYLRDAAWYDYAD